MPIPDWALAVGPVLEGQPGRREAWAAVLLVCAATLAGAWLARRNARRITPWLAMASATMLVTALIDLLPDAWSQAHTTGTPVWALGLAIASGFLAITCLTRGACGHGYGRPRGRSGGLHAPGQHRRSGATADAALFGGIGTAAALTLHRGLEGATLALSPSAVVVVALIVHSASEGLALAALLDIARRRLTPWLILACAGPAVGVLTATLNPLPGPMRPLLLGVIMGVLLRTAIVGLGIAASRQPGGRLSKRQIVIAATFAIAVGALLATAHTLREHEVMPFAVSAAPPAQGDGGVTPDGMRAAGGEADAVADRGAPSL